MKLFAVPGNVALVAPKVLEHPHCSDRFPHSWRSGYLELKANGARSVVGTDKVISTAAG